MSFLISRVILVRLWTLTLPQLCEIFIQGFVEFDLLEHNGESNDQFTKAKLDERNVF